VFRQKGWSSTRIAKEYLNEMAQKRPNIPKHVLTAVLMLHNSIFNSSYVIKRDSMASLMTSLKFCNK